MLAGHGGAISESRLDAFLASRLFPVTLFGRRSGARELAGAPDRRRNNETIPRYSPAPPNPLPERWSERGA